MFLLTMSNIKGKISLIKVEGEAMYIPNEKRYDKMPYNKAGKSGLKLPAISLGLWQNFGYNESFENIENMCRTAFDLGIVHFDLANNYGNPSGSAEENFKKVLDRGLREFRDELCISTKAGYDMWAGPYGDKNGSRKYLTSSLDQSLKRMGLDYVDVFYHHVFDPNTPLEETALALDNAVKQGKTLYVGISNYNKKQTKEIKKIFDELRTPFILNQPSYSMLNRWIEEDGLRDYAADEGIGLAVFSPLYQGFLTNRYLNGVEADSRIGKGNTWIASQLNDKMLAKLNRLNQAAQDRGQSLSQLALSWVLREGKVTTCLIGASKSEQIKQNAEAAYKIDFTQDELERIEAILRG